MAIKIQHGWSSLERWERSTFGDLVGLSTSIWIMLELFAFLIKPVYSLISPLGSQGFQKNFSKPFCVK